MNIKSLIKREYKNKIKYFLSRNNHTFDQHIGRKKAVVCLGADYGNLGDAAITFAQMEFLKQLFPDYEVFEFPISKTYTDMKSLEAVIGKDDIITIAGGGNTSERYCDIEECRQFIISRFCHNTIISFPQSVELSDAQSNFISKMNSIYSKAENFVFITRDHYSSEAFKKYLPTVKSFSAPDIVLSKKVNTANIKRNDITLSLRNDKERSLNESHKLLIKKTAEETGYKVNEKDTQINENLVFTEEVRKKLLREHLEAYQSSKLVITDRLHGMILSYISNTPCIVFSGDSSKIKGVYEWISDSERVIFLDRFDENTFKEALNKMLETSASDNKNIDFTRLENEIKNMVSKC